MKEHRLKQWKKDNCLDTLLFFALRCRELIFDYTLDSFKYPALNSSTICNEALFLIDEIEEENFTPKSIIPVLEELIVKLRNDLVVKKLIGDDLKYYINFGDYSNLKEIRIKIEILHNKLSPLNYINFLQIEIKKLISENKEKKNIYELTTTYISTLINIGFSQTYIYAIINKFFFSSNEVNNISILDSFFESFHISRKKYRAIYKASELYEEIAQSSKVFDITIIDNLEDEILALDEKNFLKSKNRNERFLIMDDIFEFDPVSAKNSADELINKLSNLFVFFHHKTQPNWSNNALIINESGEAILVKDKTSAMTKTTDYLPKKAAIKFNNLIRKLKLNEHSFTKYNRVIELHGISVQNKIIENQLLQNWIAFETLLVGYENTTKIDQVLKNLIPFLMIRYVRLQINELLRDINRFDKKFFYSQIKKIPEGDNLIEKFTAILVLDKYKSNRIDFYQRLEFSPLNKFRLSQFHKIFSNVEELRNHIEKHRVKVEWQIKRMYRTRNLIVHAGVVPSFTESLVENSHTYLDTLISTINHLCINENSIRSIEQGLKEIEIVYNKQKNILKEVKSIDDNNFLKVLL